MRYTVTGGAGFIGSNLADALAQNHDVVIIDNLATGQLENIEHLANHSRMTFIEGSVTDLDLLMETFQNAKIRAHTHRIDSEVNEINVVDSNACIGADFADSGADKGEKNRNKFKEGNYYMTTWSLKNMLRTFYRVHHSQMV